MRTWYAWIVVSTCALTFACGDNIVPAVGVPLVHLDGLVNNDLFAAYQRGEYTTWVVANVEWLVDRPAGPLDRSVVVSVEGVLSRIVAAPH